MRYLSTVEDSFQIKGRGIVIAPGIPLDIDKSHKILTGDKLELRKPDGRVVRTYVAGIEMISVLEPKIHDVPVLLGKGITKDDCPKGSEVWHEPSS